MSSSFTLDETDAGVRSFPSLPESPVPRQQEREVDPLPQVGDEHMFHQQVCTHLGWGGGHPLMVKAGGHPHTAVL